MKKLIFRKFALDTVNFFLLILLIFGLIVWTLQAVNYLDFITDDGHGLKTYFLFTSFNFPKILHRLIPFVFFISIFFIITNYEYKNELLIYWSNGISKIKFTNNLILLSIILLFFQIVIGGFISPLFQYKARAFLKNSNIDYFSALMQEGKFINAVDGLTIFINSKNIDGSFSNIFIDDSSKSNKKMIYAKNGVLINNSNKKIFQLYNGNVFNQDQSRINSFEFDQIDFNLSEFSSNTILVPKIQETSSKDLFNCLLFLLNNPENKIKFNYFNCEKSIKETVSQEMLKRFYKPFYLPVIALMCSFLIIVPKNDRRYIGNRKMIFSASFFILLISETSLRYAKKSDLTILNFLCVPWLFFIMIYYFFYKKVKNV